MGATDDREMLESCKLTVHDLDAEVLELHAQVAALEAWTGKLGAENERLLREVDVSRAGLASAWRLNRAISKAHYALEAAVAKGEGRPIVVVTDDHEVCESQTQAVLAVLGAARRLVDDLRGDDLLGAEAFDRFLLLFAAVPAAVLAERDVDQWDRGYAQALLDDGYTLESSGYDARVNPNWSAARIAAALAGR
jgi:hypothetical protein